MSMTLEIHPEQRFLHVCATGAFSLPDAEKTFLEMMDAVAKNHAQEVLFDGRALTGEPVTMERFYYGEFAANTLLDYSARGVPLATRFAYVLSPPILDPARFGETVAVNRGMHVRAFDNLDHALNWLGTVP